MLPASWVFAQDGLGVADGAIGDKFTVVSGGVTKKLTEIEARDELTKKVAAATAAGKGLDVERRGQFNEKALFSEDFYFKYGLRPTPEDLQTKRDREGPPEIPFAPVQRRYTGYKKFEGRINSGLELYTGAYRTAIQEGKWAEVAQLLEKGTRGKGSNAQGEGSGTPASDLRSSCRAMGLFGNTVLQSENDSSTTAVNLLTRHLINELYFTMDDVAAAAKAGDKATAKQAWTRGRDYINEYLYLVNLPINAKVGDKFSRIEIGI
eukprot:CAMPEP_0174713672 /NCGR_PEP_ID=MMETSP1094-20130205/14265_1 /TAXON_ID=156173 /ORGANISM="Chrysochromulina brevifilum, Strain UTEX LB 985" /LENGTH=263 /DNA_ID=CAMNT_0015912873 /DNA_START=63 /DNA_END=854 /DNA_ORIENTATION=+